ncbi:MAG: hypothetical protein EA362_02880 [Saprospirales bacterium]|nr:MAG: hypothetical protein EA362_02880 [Saprospirales bacterium]
MKSPDVTVLLFEDDFFLAITATTSYKCAKKSRQPKVACKQRGRESKTAMGNYNYITGQIIVTFYDRGNYQSFKKHLKRYYTSTKIIQ